MSVTVIGGGIVGLATAYRLLQSGRKEVRVLEKERSVGMHQSTHNSGVLHAGLYYRPGSLKAQLAREGLAQMVSFCREHAIAHEQCGKLVIATAQEEIPRLRSLLERGTANGLTGLRWIEGSEIADIEPNAVGVAAVHVPEEGIVDYAGVCERLRALIVELGGEIVLSARVRSLSRTARGWSIRSKAGDFESARIVTCGGLHADRVARMAGESPDVRIVPFRGEYWTLRPDRAHLVRHLIYPVPDPTFPFLGVHFTRMIAGGVEAGPNAVLALSREGYRWRNVSPYDLAETLAFPGLWRFVARHPRVVAYEVLRSASKRLFLASLKRFVPALVESDLLPGPSGVRAQVMTRSGELVQDFLLLHRPDAVHVLNAPSPAATASMAIGSEVARLVG